MICNKCHINKTESEFPKHSGIWLRHTCKECYYPKQKVWVKKSKSKNLEHYRKLKSRWEKEQREMISYSYANKIFLTENEALYAVRHWLLILKRNIKKYEKL
jgi:hypothetical protein